jgi:hypothetical protein
MVAAVTVVAEAAAPTAAAVEAVAHTIAAEVAAAITAEGEATALPAAAQIIIPARPITIQVLLRAGLIAQWVAAPEIPIAQPAAPAMLTAPAAALA